MSANLKKYLPILMIISEVKDKDLQKKLINYFSNIKKFKLAVREISTNVIKGNVNLTKYKKNKLSKKKKFLYSIAFDKKLSSKQFGKNLNQTGGSFLSIIPLIASLIL